MDMHIDSTLGTTTDNYGDHASYHDHHDEWCVSMNTYGGSDTCCAAMEQDV